MTKEWVEYAELNPGVIGLVAHYISDLLIANNYNEIGLHLKKTIDYFLNTQKYPEDTNMIVPIKALPLNNDLPLIPGLDKMDMDMTLRHSNQNPASLILLSPGILGFILLINQNLAKFLKVSLLPTILNQFLPILHSNLTMSNI
jgi:hypothetical protein